LPQLTGIFGPEKLAIPKQVRQYKCGAHTNEMNPEFLTPEWSISRAGCYELLKIHKYTGVAATTTYDCLCLRCGTRHVIERKLLLRIANNLSRRLGKQSKFWLQIRGFCPACTDLRAPLPALPENCISKATFFCHKLNAYGLQVDVVADRRGTTVKITHQGKIADLRRCRLNDPDHTILASMSEPDLAGDVDVETALRAFLAWANRQDLTLLRWQGGEISLRYASAFGGPGELRD
jgi:hypothetical protein